MQVITKNDLRKHFKAIRTTMSNHDRRTQDFQIFKNTISTEQYKNARELLAYVSSPIEVDTYVLIAYSWQVGKKVFVPKCKPNSNDMDFFLINSFDDLEQGAFGIYEPKLTCERVQRLENPCCIVPALSYDKRGYRLGFGKGFYDKFLCSFHGAKVGICYDNCICVNGEVRLATSEHYQNSPLRAPHECS